MDANTFRRYYDYHFAENRKTWNDYIKDLPEDLFNKDVNYSQGSVRNQIVHLISVDEAWFSDLRGKGIPDSPDPATLQDKDAIRAYWDSVERFMGEYLETLQDGRLNEKPLKGEDENLILWQVLLHVINHGTDHRAQILRQLNDMGIKTGPQDYVFYLYDNP
ncbi:MAG: hypothetical protein EPO32_13310 [Anaerolineae bacterium]|nr:MAG: hypothetical protein EPO32_13310 [Anaerolineae bacterium]